MIETEIRKHVGVSMLRRLLGSLLVAIATTVAVSVWPDAADASLMAASASAPSTTAASPAEPDGTGARVVLGCGSDTSTRVVTAFDAPVAPGQEAMLYLVEPTMVVVTVGSQVPAAPELIWGIRGVFLGPWPVGTIDDACSPAPGDGSGALVRLRCGATAASRQILSFQAPVQAGQAAILYLGTPQAGGVAATVVAERDEIPAFSDLWWSIRDVELGPWRVGTVEDSCGVLDGPLPPGSNGGLLTLRCGSRPTTRIIESFQAPVEPGQEARLYLASAGGHLTTAQVGDEVLASAGFLWGIVGVQLGPWPVQTVADACAPASTTTAPAPSPPALPATGPSGSTSLTAMASGLVVGGLLLLVFQVHVRAHRRPER